jgi:hypothetical protein
VRRDIQTPGSGSDLTHYESLGVAIAVPIGPSGGAGQFPGQDEIVGRETISERKGREKRDGGRPSQRALRTGDTGGSLTEPVTIVIGDQPDQEESTDEHKRWPHLRRRRPSVRRADDHRRDGSRRRPFCGQWARKSVPGLPRHGGLSPRPYLTWGYRTGPVVTLHYYRLQYVENSMIYWLQPL